MKLSDLRPCDRCGEKIAPQCYVVDISAAIVNAKAVNQIFGLNQFFGGRALGLAEAMAPDTEALLVFGDKEPTLRTRLLICPKCYLHHPIDLAVLVEERNEAIKRATRNTQRPDEEVADE